MRIIDEIGSKYAHHLIKIEIFVFISLSLVLSLVLHPRIKLISLIYIIIIFSLVIFILYIIRNINKIFASPHEFAEIIKNYINICPPLCIILMCYNIRNKNNGYNQAGEYSVPSPKSLFKETTSYFLISFIIIIILYLIILSNMSFELVAIDSIATVPLGGEKTVNISVDSPLPFCSQLAPTIVLDHGDLPKDVNISFMLSKGSPQFTSMLIIKVSENARDYNGSVYIYGYWAFFSSMCNFFKFHKNETRFDLRIPKLVAVIPNKTSPQAAGAEITWTAEISRNMSNSSLLYVFKKDSFKIKESNGTWIWKTNQEDKGENIIEVEVYKNKLLVGKSDKIYFMILENKPPIIRSIQKHDECNFFTVTAEDPEKDKIYYKYQIRKKGSDKWDYSTDWSQDSSWAQNIPLKAEDKYELTIMVRDEMHIMDVPNWIGSNATRDINVVANDITHLTDGKTEETDIDKTEETDIGKTEETDIGKTEAEIRNQRMPDRYDRANTTISVITSEY